MTVGVSFGRKGLQEWERSVMVVVVIPANGGDYGDRNEMPHEGLPICVHDSDADIAKGVVDYHCPDQYWLIKEVVDKEGWLIKRLIECKHCGKQRWTTTKRVYGTLEKKEKP